METGKCIVIPIFKKGDKSSPNNYRPVSLLSSVGKVMEKCIFKDMYNYFKDNDLSMPKPGSSRK